MRSGTRTRPPCRLGPARTDRQRRPNPPRSVLRCQGFRHYSDKFLSNRACTWRMLSWLIVIKPCRGRTSSDAFPASILKSWRKGKFERISLCWISYLSFTRIWVRMLFSPSVGCGASATRQFTDSTQHVLDFHRRPSEILAYASDPLRHAYRLLRDRLDGG